jgi:phosphoserine phosphatase RsbU/P
LPPFLRLNFSTGDTLLLCTDGATESLNRAGEEFGEERLLETLKQHRELSSEELLAKGHRPSPAIQP